MTKSKKHQSIKKIGALEFRRLDSKRIEYCVTNHFTAKQSVKRSGLYSVFILGMPVGSLCNICTKEWIEIWKKYSECPRKDSNLHTQ